MVFEKTENLGTAKKTNKSMVKQINPAILTQGVAHQADILDALRKDQALKKSVMFGEMGGKRRVTGLCYSGDDCPVRRSVGPS